MLLNPWVNVLVVNDLIATRGNAVARIHLIRALKGNVARRGFIIDLPESGGSNNSNQWD